MAIPRGVLLNLSRMHGALYRWTGGRLGASMGAPILLLTTRGRRSGRMRTAPLIYADIERGWVVAASNGGDDADPHWWSNLQARPQASVQIGADETPVRARVLGGEEHAAQWPRMVQLYPGYEAYRKERSREIPLIALERIQAPA